jgi:hypothetical protein
LRESSRQAYPLYSELPSVASIHAVPYLPDQLEHLFEARDLPPGLGVMFPNAAARCLSHLGTIGLKKR